MVISRLNGVNVIAVTLIINVITVTLTVNP
jgi:hypothetical protein